MAMCSEKLSKELLDEMREKLKRPLSVERLAEIEATLTLLEDMEDEAAA